MAAGHAQLRLAQVPQEIDAEMARAEESFARLEQEREVHHRRIQDLEQRLDRRSLRAHDTNVE
eukprot:4056288-Pyramimonas_sp.AAC.1